MLVAVTLKLPPVLPAVKSPVVEIKPPEADQMTKVFDVPVTMAENCCVAPAATVADVGLIEIATLAVAEVGVVDEVEVPAQPARLNAANEAHRRPANAQIGNQGRC